MDGDDTWHAARGIEVNRTENHVYFQLKENKQSKKYLAAEIGAMDEEGRYRRCMKIKGKSETVPTVFDEKGEQRWIEMDEDSDGNWAAALVENGGLSGRKRARGGDSVSPRDSARGEQAASTKVVSQSGNKTEPQGSGRKPAIKLKPQASKVTYLHTLHRHCTAIRSAQPSGAHRPPCCTGLHAAQASMLPSGSTQRRHGHCWLRYALPRVASLAGR